MHSQASRILRHLERGRSITPLQALDKFDCLRLAPRILELRELGYPVEREWETSPDGEKLWARYYLGAR